MSRPRRAACLGRRLSTLRYPKAPNVPTRYVEFTYGDADSAADATSTIARMRSRYGTEPYRPAATFGHIAEGRRAWMTLGDDLLTQSYGLDTTSGGTPAGVGLAGLDGLGRLRGLSYFAGPHDDPGDALLAFTYTYDLAGQRLTAERTPRPNGGLDLASIEKQVNEYDALMRLTMSDLRHYADANDPTGVPLQSDVWTLDSWGTWANRLTLSPTADTNDDPQHVDAWSVGHVPDPRAAISSITRTLDEYPGGDPQQIAVIPPDHDAAGNIVYDGTYIYQYDAWSRLVQVNLAAQPPPGGGPAVGDAVPGTQQLAGALVKHFTYDGLGRLVRVLSPYPEPGATPPEGWTVAPVRSERLYYDGVRRIQEVYTDPLLALGESAALGDPEAQGEVSQGGEEEGQILEGEEEQIESGSGEPGGEEPPGPPPNTFITYLEREYLWGPGDGITSGAGAGLDELVAIFDIDRRAWWTLLDASGDVVAIVDDGGATAHGFGTGSPTTSEARLCAQFCYDAYGALLSIQGLHPFPDPRTGHKGLHLDRLDAGVADPLSGAAIPRHEVGAEHAYFVRNRHYSPELGRFLQRDFNGKGGVAVGIASLGRQHPLVAPKPSLAEHNRDGVGVYGWLRQSPQGGVDPLGLFDFSLLGLLGTSSTTAEMQGEWTQTVMEYGLETGMNVKSLFGSVGWEQADAATLYSDWDVSDTHLQSNYGGVAVAAMVGLRRAEDVHHVIPRFLLGLDIEDNRMRLPPHLHQEYHRLLREEWKSRGLPPINGRKERRWVTMLTKGDIKPDQVNHARSALMESARKFDDLTGGAYRLAERVRLGFNARHYADGVLDVGQTLRRYRRGR